MMGQSILEEWELMREESLDWSVRKNERIDSKENQEHKKRCLASD